MTEDDFQEIDGVGSSREERLNEAGYETFKELGQADHEELAENIKRLPEDSALEIVVQAQNLADLEEAEVSEGEVDEDSDADGADSASENEEVAQDSDVDEADSASENEETFEVSFEFDSVYEYDTFYHTLIEERCNLRRTNRAGVGSYEKMIDSMRQSSPTGEFSVEMNAEELNDLHNAVLEQRIEYQGDNLIDYMDALKVVEANVNAVRDEFLF